MFRARVRLPPQPFVSCPPTTTRHSPYLDREYWAPLLKRHGDLIPDPTMLTLLRPDCRRPHGADNAMLVPRLKFVCIELAREREGLNDARALLSTPQQEHQQQPVASNGGEAGQPPQLVIRRTRKYSAIGVAPTSDPGPAAPAVEEGDEREVEEAVAALLAQQGVGENASEEGAFKVYARLLMRKGPPTDSPFHPPLHPSAVCSARGRPRRGEAAAGRLPGGTAGEPRWGGGAGARGAAPLGPPPHCRCLGR